MMSSPCSPFLGGNEIGYSYEIDNGDDAAQEFGWKYFGDWKFVPVPLISAVLLLF
jgi:hypothetical protein